MTTSRPLPQLFTREGKPFNGQPITDDRGRQGLRITSRTCGRCGGVGGADKWAYTGWKCFECEGRGEVPCDRFVPLYTAEKLDALNAAQVKASATRAAKAAERTRLETERRERDHAQVVADHRDFIARASGWGDQFLASLIAQIEVQARPLSPAQMDAGMAKITKLEAEKARRLAARHVGQIGQRLTLTLTHVRTLDFGDRFNPFHIVITRDQDGNSVTYKGAASNPFDFELVRHGESRDSHYTIAPGATSTVKATVKEHGFARNTGEPETIVARPKRV